MKEDPESSRFFFLGPVPDGMKEARWEERKTGENGRILDSLRARSLALRGAARRGELGEDARGNSRFVQEPVDVPTRRQARIDPPIAVF